MSTPTYGSAALPLTTDSEWDAPGSPQARMAVSHMPSQDGAYVSQFGQGHRMIQGGGWLAQTSTTAALAVKALKDYIRGAQLDCVNTFVANYVGADGVTYANCVMVSYEAEPGGILVQYNGASSYTARVRVSYQILQTIPTSP